MYQASNTERNWARTGVMAKTLVLTMEAALEKMLEEVRRLAAPTQQISIKLLNLEVESIAPGNPGPVGEARQRLFSFDLDRHSTGCYQGLEERMISKKD